MAGRPRWKQEHEAAADICWIYRGVGVVKGLRAGEDANSNTTVPFELSQTKDFQRAL